MENLHSKVIKAIQSEWEENNDKHTEQRQNVSGIRSSQISALIEYLIDIGVINESNYNGSNKKD